MANQKSTACSSKELGTTIVATTNRQKLKTVAKNDFKTAVTLDKA